MKKLSFKKMFSTNKPILIVIALVLISLYSYTVSSFLASPPSEGFSREVYVDEVMSGSLKNVYSHIQVMELSSNDKLILAVDGHQIKLIKINNLGEVVDNTTLELDLFESKKIEACLIEDKSIQIYYLDKGLQRANVDLLELSFYKETIAEAVKDFQYSNEQLVLEFEDGLYLLDTTLVQNDEKESNISKEQMLPLVKGAVYSFDFDVDKEVVSVYATMKNLNNVDRHYTTYSFIDGSVKDYLIEENSGDSFTRTVKDVYLDGNVVTTLFVFVDMKYGSTYLTVLQSDSTTGEELSRFKHEFSMHKSDYELQNVEENKVELILQESTDSGVNLVHVKLEPNMKSQIIPLTKTRKLSVLANAFENNAERQLVFYDVSENNKIIYFASSNPSLIEKTTKVFTISPTRILSSGMIIFLQAAFMGAVVFVLIVALGPFLLFLLLSKLTGEFKGKVYVISMIGVLVHLGLKIYLTYYLIHIMGNYSFAPMWIGSEPLIYVVLVITSVLSYWMMMRYVNQNLQYKSTPMTGYMKFVFYEYVQYTLLVYIYTSTSLILNKI